MWQNRGIQAANHPSSLSQSDYHKHIPCKKTWKVAVMFAPHAKSLARGWKTDGIWTKLRGGDVARLEEHQTNTPLTQIWFPGAARDFPPRFNFLCRLSYSVHTSLCAIACIYISPYVKDHVLHVRVWWILETLKHPACTVCCVARLLQLAFPKESYPIYPWEKSYCDNTAVKKIWKRK